MTMGITKTAYEKTKKVYETAAYYRDVAPKMYKADDFIGELIPIAEFLCQAGKDSLSDFMYRKCNEILIMFGETPVFWDSRCRLLK